MSSIPYRPDIDGLRAVAVASVIAFHAFPDFAPGGFVGVDIFFVISGFLISSILLQDAQVGGISITSFYARRVLRIFPALVLVLATCLGFGWHTLLGDEYKQLGRHIFSGSLFAANLQLWSEVSYFDNNASTKPLLHLWSLGIEEQFYIVWPLLLALLLRMGQATRIMLVTVLMGSLIYSGYEVFHNSTAAFYSPFSRAWELLAGSLLAYANVHQYTLRWPQHRALWVGLGLLCLCGSVFALKSNLPFPGFTALPAVIGTGLLIATGPHSTVISQGLSQRLIVGLGRISYPLYLWHWPLLSFATIFASGQPSWETRLALVLLSLLLAMATYHGLEMPLRQLPRKKVVGILLAGMILLALLGNNIYLREGLSEIRYRSILELEADAKRDFVDWGKSGLISEEQCEVPFQFPGRTYCVKKHSDIVPSAAVIGDSHAFHAYWGLAEALDKHGENLIAVGRGACVPLLDYFTGDDADKCQPHINTMWKYISDTPSIKKVYVVFRGRYLPNSADDRSADAFAVALERTLSRMQSAGKQVFYFFPVVETGYDPRLCLGNLPFGRRPPQQCEISRNEDAKHWSLLRRITLTVFARHPEARLIDPNDLFCHGDRCPVVNEGRSMFKDENHLSYSGSLFQARALGNKIFD